MGGWEPVLQCSHDNVYHVQCLLVRPCIKTLQTSRFFLPFHLQPSQTGSRTDASRCWEWNGRENLADDIIRVIGESGSQPTDRAREGERTGPAPKCSHSDLYVSGSLPRWPTRRDDRPRERSRCSPPHIFPGPEFSQTPHPFHGDTRPMY